MSAEDSLWRTRNHRPDAEGVTYAGAFDPMRQLLQQLRSLADRFPVDERPTISPASSEESIAALQVSLPLPLPTDFMNFLRICGGVIAMDVYNGLWIGGATELSRIVNRGDFPATIGGINGLVPVVPIGGDGGGNAFLLSLEPGNVWRWDHETGRVNCVATTFPDFLGWVLQDFEHFLLGDESWRYLSASKTHSA